MILEQNHRPLNVLWPVPSCPVCETDEPAGGGDSRGEVLRRLREVPGVPDLHDERLAVLTVPLDVTVHQPRAWGQRGEWVRFCNNAREREQTVEMCKLWIREGPR